jgi:phosphoribosylglycinamide formyltransferase 1
MKNIAIFASGSGTNAENIMRYFSNHDEIRVSAIFCNNKEAGVLQKAENLQIQSFLFGKEALYSTGEILDYLKSREIHLVVLAGFLWLLPGEFIQEFRNRILNIHPALLPKYGGKGMYGKFVHNEVIANKEKESGITVHLVNEEYDRGDILFQAKCPVMEGDDANSLAKRIHELEYQHYPVVIENFLLNRL